MDYGRLITRAFQIAIRYKFLWPLGFLASFAEGGGIHFPSFPGSYDSGHRDSSLFGTLQGTRDFSVVREFFPPDFFDRPPELPVILLLAALALIVALGVIVVSTMARGGVIASTAAIESGEPISFSRAFSIGYRFFWRLLALGLVVGLLALGVLAVLAAPVVILAVLKIYWAAILVGIPMLLLFIPMVIYLTVLWLYAARFVVLRGNGVRASMANAHSLMLRHKGEVTLVWLLAVALGIGIAIGMVIAMLVVGLPLGLIGYLIYTAAGLLPTLIYGVIFGSIFLLGLFLLIGITTAFRMSYWTLAFLDFTSRAPQEIVISPPPTPAPAG